MAYAGAATRPKFSLERRGGGQRQKMTPPKWSHQKDLEAMIGKTVTLTFTHPAHGSDGAMFERFASGMLVNADQFTIQIADARKSIVTYFKHSVASYELAPVPV